MSSAVQIRRKTASIQRKSSMSAASTLRRTIRSSRSAASSKVRSSVRCSIADSRRTTCSLSREIRTCGNVVKLRSTAFARKKRSSSKRKMKTFSRKHIFRSSCRTIASGRTWKRTKAAPSITSSTGVRSQTTRSTSRPSRSRSSSPPSSGRWCGRGKRIGGSWRRRMNWSKHGSARCSEILFRMARIGIFKN